jgi:hypothetical protein
VLANGEREESEKVANDGPAERAQNELMPDAADAAQLHVSCADVNARPQAKRPFFPDTKDTERTDLHAAKAETCVPSKQKMAAFMNGYDKEESRQQSQKDDQERIVLVDGADGG